MNLPTFAAGNYDKIQASIESSLIKYPAYVYIRDQKKLAFIDKDNSINVIIGDNKTQVLNVETLPEIADGDTEVLYIYQGIVYVFTGTEYKPMYVDHTSEIEGLKTRVETLETSKTDLINRVETLEETVSDIQTSSGLTFVELDGDSTESTEETT